MLNIHYIFQIELALTQFISKAMMVILVVLVDLKAPRAQVTVFII